MRVSIRWLALFLLGTVIAPGASAVDGQIGNTVVYNLYATDGYVEMADGLPVYVYGFIGGREGVAFTYRTSYCAGDGTNRTCGTPTNVTVPGGPLEPSSGPLTGQETQFAGNAQYPGPVLYGAVGDTIVIRLKNLGVAAQPNAPDEARSLYFHGLDLPEQTALLSPGDAATYTLRPSRPGTYFYSSHEDAHIQTSMGLFGALVVYNPDDPAAATGPGLGMGGSLYGLAYDRDFVLLLSGMDIRGSADEEGTYGGIVPAPSWFPDPFNWALYRPEYWFINGLSYPQTTHEGFPSGYTFPQWLVAHPSYDPLIAGSMSVLNSFWDTPGEKVLLRVVNAGFQNVSLHMHGYHGKVIGSDQRAWDWGFAPRPRGRNASRPFGEGLEKSTLTIGPGETYEWLIDLGGTPGGVASQMFPFHAGDHSKCTNDGFYPGGMYTMIMPAP